MLSALFLAAAAGPLVTFKDMVAGCDNGRSCMAVGQYSERDMNLASIVIERGARSGDAPVIWFRNEDKIVDLAADGKRLNVKLSPDADDWALTVDPASVPQVIAALKTAASLVPIEADGSTATPLSISGASAAMRWIDAQQKRAGTVTAMVATGSAPASSVPPPPLLPVVHKAMPSGTLARPLTDAQIRTIQQQHAGCTDNGDFQDKVDYGRIDARTTLALVTAVCASGAYNMDVTPLLIRDNGQRVVATFEGGGEEGDITMNLSWDDKKRVLSSSFKGRGIGDCGGGADWVWDGQIFRPIKETLMSECLGAIAWITVFRAKPVYRGEIR